MNRFLSAVVLVLCVVVGVLTKKFFRFLRKPLAIMFLMLMIRLSCGSAVFWFRTLRTGAVKPLYVNGVSWTGLVAESLGVLL